MTEWNVHDNGAKGDGVTKDTCAIQHTINLVAESGGGTVYFPAGCYLSGTLYLENHVHLLFSPGAILLGSPDSQDYNADDFCAQNHAEPTENASGAHLIVAIGKVDIAISGGCIDGNSKVWLNKPYPHYPGKFMCDEWRPGQMLFFCECSNVRLHDTELLNAPYWTSFFYGCRKVFIDNVRIWNDFRTPNGDGFDIDCCKDVSVCNCQIESGDDCFAIRADASRTPNIDGICERITVTNCILKTPCNAFRIGVGNGEIRNCIFNNCIIQDSRTGICLVSKYGSATSGVEIHDINFTHIQLETQRPILISSDVRGCQDEPSPAIYNINLHHLYGSGIHSCYIVGNTDCQLHHISLSDISLEYHGGADIADAQQQQGEFGEFGIVTANAALYLQNASDIDLEYVRIRWGKTDGPWETAIKEVNIKELRTTNCTLPVPIQ